RSRAGPEVDVEQGRIRRGHLHAHTVHVSIEIIEVVLFGKDDADGLPAKAEKIKASLDPILQELIAWLSRKSHRQNVVGKVANLHAKTLLFAECARVIANALSPMQCGGRGAGRDGDILINGMTTSPELIDEGIKVASVG